MSVTLSILSQPAAVSLSKNSVDYKFTAIGSASESNIKVHLYLSMYVGGSATAVQSVSLSARPDADDAVKFDVSSILRHADNYAFTYPDASLGGKDQSSLRNYFTAHYYTTYTDSNGDVITSSTVDIAAINYIDGGISEDDAAYLRDEDSDWWTFFKTSQLFLNFMPGAKRTVVGASEKLYWYAFRTATESLRIRWTATNGTTGTIHKAVAMTENHIYELTVSPTLVEDYLSSSLSLASYKVDIDGFLSVQQYVINSLSYRNSLFFLFQNQYGVWETLWCKGQLTETHKYIKENVTLSKNLSAGRLVHENISIKNKLEQSGQINTGILDGNDWALWASDILSGNPVYLCDGERLMPIRIDSDTAVIKQVPNYEFLYMTLNYSYSKVTNFPNRLIPFQHNILVMTQEDGNVVTDEDGRTLIYE